MKTGLAEYKTLFKYLLSCGDRHDANLRDLAMFGQYSNIPLAISELTKR